MNACDARFRCRCCSPGEIRSRSRMHAHQHTRATPLARARHTHTIHDDTTGPEVGDCMLVDGGSGTDHFWSDRRPPNCRKPALERLARHSLFDRYMKAQLRLAGGRRKLGRNGFRSDLPRECVDPPEYLRNLRNLRLLQRGCCTALRRASGRGPLGALRRPSP